jgi:hypothetical protein
MDQRTFDALWGAQRPADEASPVADETPAKVDEAPAEVEDAPAMPDGKNKHKAASEL